MSGLGLVAVAILGASAVSCIGWAAGSSRAGKDVASSPATSPTPPLPRRHASDADLHELRRRRDRRFSSLAAGSRSMNERAGDLVEFADCTFDHLPADFDDRTARRSLTEIDPAWADANGR